MGQGGVGALLELGPEGDMGGCHLVGVLDLYPLSPSPPLALFSGVGAFGFLFSFATGVLGWRELSYSAVKVNGDRSYALRRAGEEVQLKPKIFKS